MSSNSNTFPAIRLGSVSEGEAEFHEVEVDFKSPTSKFGFTWPDGQKCLDPSPRQDHYHDALSVNITSASEDMDNYRTSDHNQEEMGPLGASETSRSSSHIGVPLPRLSRAFSMPSTSQLSHWQHPSRSTNNSEAPALNPFDERCTQTEQDIHELALELADSVQMATQTLLQLSPPHLFDPAKEQFSACSVQIPTSSVCALLTSMKNLNYISANIRVLGYPPSEGSVGSRVDRRQESMAKDEFDIGEVLQSVGDALSGVAAEAEVDLVLHHGDIIKHMCVRGDECGISYALSHIIHQVLLTTRPGDSMEIGLAITGLAISEDHSSGFSSLSSTPSPSSDSLEGSVACTFDIAHKFATPSEGPRGDPPFLEPDSEPRPSDPTDARPEPRFESMILRRLLKLIGGTLRMSLKPKLFPRGRRCELSVPLERGPPLAVLDQRTPPADDDIYCQPLSDIRLAREPSIDELLGFAETLRGKKVAFHASSQGSFAHHLTRYLTAWGMDISHVPTDGLEENDPGEGTPHLQSDYGSLASSPGGVIGISNNDNVPPIVDSASDAPIETKTTSNEAGLSLIIIDDDVQVLRRRLLQHRVETMPNLQLHPRKRPSLAAQHRPRSSPSMRNNRLSVNPQQQSSPPLAFSPVPVVHFTGLANYKLVKDAIQAMIIGVGSLPLLPEVIIIPKPAGPRRILTSLHTAVHKPYVDPFFSPIATSPMSPGGAMPPFLSGRKSASASTPPGRSGTERHMRVGSDSAVTLPPSSPLSIAEGLEYFPDVAVKTLGGNAASGLVIQSPDGRPAGIFFQPQSRMPSSRSDLSMTAMERERTSLRPVSQRSSRRNSSRKTGVQNKTDTIETCHEASPRHRSPSSKPLLSYSFTPSHCPERLRLGDQTDLLRSYKGKGRAATSGEEESHALSSAAWREATQNLAKQSASPVTLLDSNNLDSAVSPSGTLSPIADLNPISPARMVGSAGIPTPVSRSTTSPISPDAKKVSGRRQVPKSPVVPPNLKNSKAVGSNIVPPISVLIVEDNAINQTILSTFMRRNKIKYEVAWNGREAVEKWRNGNFHLILMDIQMPVMDGIEATKEIRRLEKAENIGHFPPSPGENSRRTVESPGSRPSSAASTPFRSQVIIVALTASSLQSDRVAALAAGCNDFLTKPVTNSWLNDKIIEWGSIKALQMWAELRPEVAKNISIDQAAQAQAVANKLYVPAGSVRGSPLRAGETEDSSGMFRNTHPTGVKAIRRSSTGSLSSDSSPERWRLSSDDDFTQDPITEPPAVIETPVRSAVELPPVENEPAQVTGEDALLQFLEDSKQDSQQPYPTVLGQRAISSATSSTSIAAVLHDTPGVGDTNTDSIQASNISQEISSAGQDDPLGH